jgi:hypothetical protein
MLSIAKSQVKSGYIATQGFISTTDAITLGPWYSGQPCLAAVRKSRSYGEECRKGNSLVVGKSFVYSLIFCEAKIIEAVTSKLFSTALTAALGSRLRIAS